MLLKYSDIETFNAEEADKFLTDNEDELISYISQYTSMLLDKDDDENASFYIALATINYLLNGEEEKDDNSHKYPTVSHYDFDDKEALRDLAIDIDESEFLASLFSNLEILIELERMRANGLVEASSKNGARAYKITKKGQKAIE